MSIQHLEASLRKGGTKVDEGKIRIDAARALQKLRDHRLPDPSLYVLEVLRCAVLSGATTVKVVSTAKRSEVVFDGKPLRKDLLQALPEQALQTTKDPEKARARLLALGLAGALGMHPARVKITSGELCLSISPPEEVSFSPVSPPLEGIRFEVDERFNLSVLRDAFRGGAEARHVQKLARDFPLSLTVNGKPATKAPVKETFNTRVRREGPGVSLTLSALDELGASRVTFSVLGVNVVEKALALPGLPFVAHLRLDDLRRSASGTDVVEGDVAHRRAMQMLTSAQEELTEKLVGKLNESGDPALRQHLLLVADAVFAEGSKASHKTQQALSRAKILPGPAKSGDEFFSRADFEAELKANRPIREARLKYPKGSYTTPAVLLWLGQERVWRLVPKSDNRIDIADEVKRRHDAAEREAAWAATPTEEPVLPPAKYLSALRPLQGEGFSGQVAFTADRRATLRLLCQGKLVQQELCLDFQPLRFAAVVNLARPLPASAFLELPLPIERFKWLKAALLDTALAALEAALPKPEDPVPESLAADVRGAIVYLLQSTRAKKPSELPAALLSAKAWPLAGGSFLSLKDALAQKPLRYVLRAWPHGALDDVPVIVLTQEEANAFFERLSHPLTPMAERLQRELEVRRELDGPREEPKVKGRLAVRIPLQGGGLRGEVGIPHLDGAGLSLRLLRNGYPLEDAQLTPRYELSAAAVESATLTPDPLWRHAVRDAAFEAVFSAVRDGERRLMEKVCEDFSEKRLDELPPSVRRYVSAFLVKELGPSQGGARADELCRKAARAFFFRTSAGELPLSELLSRLEKEEGLFHLPQLVAKDAAELSFFTLTGDLPTAELVAKVAGRPLENGATELDRRRVRKRFLDQPEVEASLAPRPAIWVKVSSASLSGEVGFVDGFDRAEVELLYASRKLTDFQRPSALGLRGKLTWREEHDVARPLPPSMETELDALLEAARAQLCKKALGLAFDGDDVRTLLLRAVTHAEKLLGKEAHVLLTRPLFPVLGGKPTSASKLDELGKVAYITRPLEPPKEGTVVLADDPHLRAALGRFGSRAVDVTAQLFANEEAKRRRLAEPEWKEISLRTRATMKVAIAREGVRGEIGLSPEPSVRGELWAFAQSRPLAALPMPEPLPPFFHAAVNADELQLSADGASLERNAAYTRLMGVLVAELHSLTRELEAGARFPSLPEGEQRALMPLVAQLALWARKDRAKAAALQGLPLFEASNGGVLSLKALFAEQAQSKRVRYSELSGSLLDQEALVLMPRRGELELLTGLKLKLVDVSGEVSRANKLKEQPKLTELKAFSSSPFRADVSADGFQGEVALSPDRPSRKLELTLVRDGLVLEKVETEHALGATALISSPAFRANAKQTGVVRDQVFRDARQAVDDAILRAAVLRLKAGGGGQRAWAAALCEDDELRSDPEVSAALAALTPFKDLKGQPVSLGEAWARIEKDGALLTAEPGSALPSSQPIIERTREAELWCIDLDLEQRDVTEALRAEKLREKSKADRKVAKLRYEGDVLHRRELSAKGLRGELCVPDPLAPPAHVTLVKDGVRICGVPVLGELVAGVVEVDDLSVNADWTSAELTAEQKKALAGEAEATVSELCERTDLPPGQRPRLAEYVLHELSRVGVSTAAHIENLSHAARALSLAKTFATPDGRFVDALTLASEVRRRGTLHLLEGTLPPERPVEELVLSSRSLRGDGEELLKKLFGDESIRVHASLAAFDRARAEVDPELDTPLGKGLLLLRKEARLLRTHAIGRLSDKELTAIKVERGDGSAPCRYDAARKVALLDVGNAKVRRGLEEATVRPERLYVLLAAIFGAVNRALDKVTDEDEARLTAALLSHLASNKDALTPKRD